MDLRRQTIHLDAPLQVGTNSEDEEALPVLNEDATDCVLTHSTVKLETLKIWDKNFTIPIWDRSTTLAIPIRYLTKFFLQIRNFIAFISIPVILPTPSKKRKPTAIEPVEESEAEATNLSTLEFKHQYLSNNNLFKYI